MSGSHDIFAGRANRPAETDDLASQTGEHWTPPAPEVPPTRRGSPPDLDGQPDHSPPVPDDGPDGGKPGFRQRLSGGLILRVVLVAAVLGGGSVWGALQAADRDEAGAIVDSGDVASDELRVGDCLNEPDSLEFETIAGVPCSDEHDVEVFHIYTLDAAAYPTDDEFLRRSSPSASNRSMPTSPSPTRNQRSTFPSTHRSRRRGTRGTTRSSASCTSSTGA